MASWISNPQVKQWIEATRMPSLAVDATLEQSTQGIIKAKLAARYDSVSWVDQASTPKLIQTISSMYNAGFQYQRQFGQDVAGYAGQENYGQRLVSIADGLIEQLATGEIDLDEVEAIQNTSVGPVFWPNDSTGQDDPNFDIKFSMGMTF